MFFNYPLFFRHLRHSLFPGKNKNLRFGPKRIRFLVFFLLLFPGLWLLTQLSFAVDNILFAGFKRQHVKKPVFILGNFRSGSTMLHRLLAKDHTNFSSIRTWEIYSAPSVTQRKFIRGLKIIDRFFGGRLYRLLMEWNNRQLGEVTIHTIGVYEPEEDEGLFYYIWYSLFVWFFFPDQFEHARFDRFDHTVPSPRKRRIMKFYRKCIQRHLYYRGKGKTYLTKNPSHTGKIDSLLQEFPDACIIYLYREPEEMISSTMSWFSFAMHYFADIPEDYPHKTVIMRMARHYYLYPKKRLVKEQPDRYMIIDYNDLTENLKGTVTKIYRQFGFSMDRKFSKVLSASSRKAKSYSSRHHHSPEKVGITEEELSRYFGGIIEFLTKN